MSVKTGIAVVQAILRVNGSHKLSVDGVLGSNTRVALANATPQLVEQANKATMAAFGLSVTDLIPQAVIQSVGEFSRDVVPALMSMATKYGLMPVAVVAQVAFESNWGKSGLSTDYHNYAGLKYNSVQGYPGVKPGSTTMKTTEFVDGKGVTLSEGFATFTSAVHFAEVYAWYLTESGSAYRYKGLRNAATPRDFFSVLKNGGYATDPAYVNKLETMVSSVERRYSFTS
jgi:flagellum-specific peptidoglycan hydrolase FlgJ